MNIPEVQLKAAQHRAELQVIQSVENRIDDLLPKVTRVTRTPLPTLTQERPLEPSAHLRRHHQPQHPRCPDPPPAQTDRGVHGPVYPNRAVGPPEVRANLGPALHHGSD